MTMVILRLCDLHQNVTLGNFYQGIVFKFLWWNWEQKKFQVVEWSFKQGKKHLFCHLLPSFLNGIFKLFIILPNTWLNWISWAELFFLSLVGNSFFLAIWRIRLDHDEFLPINLFWKACFLLRVCLGCSFFSVVILSRQQNCFLFMESSFLCVMFHELLPMFLHCHGPVEKKKQIKKPKSE